MSILNKGHGTSISWLLEYVGDEILPSYVGDYNKPFISIYKVHVQVSILSPFLGGETSNILYFHPDPWGNDTI